MPTLIGKYAYYLGSIYTLLTGIREWPLVLRVFLGAASSGEKTIQLRRSGIRFKVRGKMDIWSVKEACLDRFYERFGTRVREGWTIVDIGAGIGEFTLEAACSHPDNRVYAFEPFAESFALLQENLHLNGAGNVSAYAEAVGAQTGSLLLDLSGEEPLQMQSLHTGDRRIGQDVLLVACLSLSAVFDRLKIMRIDLLKLDCEGSEYPILFNTRPEDLARIQRIVLEYHDGVGGHTHQDLVAYLAEQGFQVRTNQNWVHAHLGYLYAWRK